MLITELSAAPAELLSKNGLLSPLNPVLKVFRRAEETALSQSAAVLTLYPRAAEHLRPAKNIRPFFVPAPPEHRESGIPVLGFPEEKGFVLACAGYSASGFCEKELMDICKSFGKDFSLIFVSEEHPPKELLRHASEKGLRNVFFPEPFPKGKIPSVLGRADAVFVPEDEHLSGFGTEQEKFFSAFLSKRPVIAAAEHNTNFLRESGGTIIIKPKSRESIRLGIGAASKLSSGDRNTLGLLNRKFAEENSPEKFAREYLSVIYECKNQKERTK